MLTGVTIVKKGFEMLVHVGFNFNRKDRETLYFCQSHTECDLHRKNVESTFFVIETFSMILLI